MIPCYFSILSLRQSFWMCSIFATIHTIIAYSFPMTSFLYFAVSDFQLCSFMSLQSCSMFGVPIYPIPALCSMASRHSTPYTQKISNIYMIYTRLTDRLWRMWSIDHSSTTFCWWLNSKWGRWRGFTVYLVAYLVCLLGPIYNTVS